MGHVPTSAFENAAEQSLAHGALADDTYHVPGPIDAVLGVGVCSKIFAEGKLHLPNGLVALSSEVGWIIMGEFLVDHRHVYCINQEESGSDCLDKALKRLWEMDQVELQPTDMTPDERWCEEYFQATCRVDTDGRYVTSISIRPDSPKLGESYSQAYERFIVLEKRLQRDKELAKKYNEFMREYLALGHMRPATRLLNPSTPHYYIPHHPVLKKFRVIFDASAKTTSGHSLNDIQLPGPKIQLDLFDIMLKFRAGRIALTADVVKMFRQVRIREEDWDFQRILWRENPKQEIN